jgi:hypothetical protein
MIYKQLYRKYKPNSSSYVVYNKEDVVEYLGDHYVCSFETSSAYLPTDPRSGFVLMSPLIIDGGRFS